MRQGTSIRSFALARCSHRIHDLGRQFAALVDEIKPELVVELSRGFIDAPPLPPDALRNEPDARALQNAIRSKCLKARPTMDRLGR